MDLVRLGDCKAVENILQQKLVRADDTTGVQTPLLVRIFTRNRFHLAVLVKVLLILTRETLAESLPNFILCACSRLFFDKIFSSSCELNYHIV